MTESDASIPQLPGQRPQTYRYLVYLRATWSVQTRQEQAQSLGISYSRVAQLRAQLLQRGLVNWSSRKTARHWTRDDIDHVQEMLEDGYSVRTIAIALGRTPHAILYAIRNHSPHKTIDAIRNQPLIAVRSQRQVAVLFGTSSRRVAHWVSRGWLVARYNDPRGAHSRGGRRRKLLITDVAIHTFLSTQAAWHTYEVDQITDPDWRQRAHDLRQLSYAGGRWVSIREYADFTNQSISTITWRCSHQQLVARRVGKHWQVCWPQPVITQEIKDGYGQSL